MVWILHVIALCAVYVHGEVVLAQHYSYFILLDVVLTYMHDAVRK
jgi:hypothetical protein